MASALGSLDNFIQDIEPFFYGRRLTYVDVGAYKGEVFKKILGSGLKLREAHLIEPNPESAAQIKSTLGTGSAARNFHLHQLALGSSTGTVRLRRALDMTKVVSEVHLNETDTPTESNEFLSRVTSLDRFVDHLTEKHISLLKIDVEGFESEVIRGAEELLSAEQIDVLYIEAGMDPNGTQQCYYREIEDILNGYGYRLFRIYEQTTEWITDSPLLRRVNLAYMSAKFARNNPYKLTHELFSLQRQLKDSQAKAENLQGQLDALTLKTATTEAAQSAAIEEANIEADALQLKAKGLEKRLAEAESIKQSLVAADGDRVRRLAESVESQRLLDVQCRELGAQLADLTKQRADLLVALDEYSELKIKFANHDIELQTLKAESKQLLDQAKLQGQRLAQARDQAELRAEELSSELQRAMTERMALGTEVTLARTQLKEIKNAFSHLETASRGIYTLFDELRLTERRARSDLRVAQYREERVRKRLAYRIGSTILESARSPIGLIGLPMALRRMYSEYKADKASGIFAPLAPESDGLAFRRDTLATVSKAIWQSLLLPTGDGVRELWVVAFCVGGKGTIALEWDFGSEEAKQELLAANRTGASLEAYAVSSLIQTELSSGLPKRLFRVPVQLGAVKFRKVRGSTSAIKFEIRTPSAESALRPDAEPPNSNDKKKSADPIVAPRTEPQKNGTREARAESPVNIRTEAVIGSLSKIDEPKRMKSAIIWQAFQIINEGRVSDGISFAERYSRDFCRPVISLFKANQVIGDDLKWVSHVNEYIQQFGIEPLTLRSTSGALFSRFGTNPCVRIEHGPLISVIMPAHNAEKTLEFAARSILAQSWAPLELIIVDDCSTDSTWQTIEEIKRSDTRVRAIRNTRNVGPYVSKNIALSIASGQYITGHDADDWAHPQRLERHVHEMRKSNGHLKASMTRMLRLSENGFFGHFAKEGKTSDDGALRDAAISCMFEADYMRKHLGYWDSVRFGADSELIGRAENILGHRFSRLRQLAMLCLDAEGSLTNDPVHGVSKVHGISPTRRFYREQWTDWHVSIDEATSYLPFPHKPRRFAAPDAAQVPDETVESLLGNLQNLDGSVNASLNRELYERASTS